MDVEGCMEFGMDWSSVVECLKRGSPDHLEAVKLVDVLMEVEGRDVFRFVKRLMFTMAACRYYSLWLGDT